MKSKIAGIVVLLIVIGSASFGWRAGGQTLAVAKTGAGSDQSFQTRQLTGGAARDFLARNGLFEILPPAASPQTVEVSEPDSLFSTVTRVTEGATGDTFGESVGVDGDHAIIGKPTHFSLGGQGAAYIYERGAGGANNWGQIKMLVAPDAAAGDRFGTRVGISGETAIVSAPGKTAIYVFERHQGGANNWGFVKKLTAGVNLSGGAIAISGDFIIAGAAAETIGANFQQGAAYIFERKTGGAGNWGQLKKITASDGAANDFFGLAVSIDGGTALVSAPLHNIGTNTNQGAAYIFERDAGGADNWGEVQKVTATDGAPNLLFGQAAVGVSGETAAVGRFASVVNGNVIPGAAYIFQRNYGGENWGAVKKIAAADGTPGDEFGRALAISDSRILVGAPYVDLGTVQNQGAAYIFERNQGGADNWGQVQKLTATIPQEAAFFGGAAALSGKTALVGAPFEKVGANELQGAAYFFSGQNAVWNQESKPLPVNCTMDDFFGWSAAIDGDTAIVGAPNADVGIAANAGAAYIFQRNQGGGENWGLVKTIVHPFGGAESDNFGWSVAVSGSRVMIGAPHREVVGNIDAGEIFIFERDTGGANNWGLIFTANSIQAGGRFGSSVAIGGDTAIAGSIKFDVGASVNQGRASIYQFSQNQFNFVRQITASDGAPGDFFGGSVSISGDLIAVSAHFDDTGANVNQGAAYLFERNTGGADNWGEIKKLTAADGAANDFFGIAVALSGENVVVGAFAHDNGGKTDQGAAYIFSRHAGGINQWGQVKKLRAADGASLDFFGNSVAIEGETVVVGSSFDAVSSNNSQGSAYIFQQNAGGAGNWGQVKKLAAADGAAYDFFGKSVALSGTTLLISANRDDVNGIADIGSSYIFKNTGADWTPQAKPLPPLPADCGTADQYGWSVAIDGDTAVVGAPQDRIGINQAQGSAYVLERNQGGANKWGLVKILLASGGAANDRFGSAVTISGDKIAVGAPLGDVDANPNQGAVYLFERNAGGANNWGEIKKLTAADGAAQEEFGNALDISGSTIVVGKYKEAGNEGAAYIFERDAGGASNWGEVKKLTIDSQQFSRRFGFSVAVDGNFVAVGSPADFIVQPTISATGAAYVFERNRGGANNWGLVKRLLAADGADLDSFGYSVAVGNGSLIVGAPAADLGANADQGAAYIFSADSGGANNWGQVRKINAADGAADDFFASSVSISGETAFVGAPSDDAGANVNQGSAYIFERGAGGANNWGQVRKLTAADGAANDFFGHAVAVNGDDFLIGAYLSRISQPFAGGKSNIFPPVEQGAGYVFRGALAAPTAAQVSISGRALTPDGRAVQNARVTLTDSNGVSRTVVTNSFGSYRFAEIPAGETYVIGARHKKYRFAAQVISVAEEISGFDLIAEN